MDFLIIANWKGVQNEESIKNALSYKKQPGITYILSPNYLAIPQLISSQNIDLCAQNIMNNELTGSISINLIKQFNIKYCLCNHADHQNNNYNPKEIIKICLNHNITPIIFVNDISEAENLGKSNNCIVVFEPHKYIGKANIPDIDEIKETIIQIKFITDNPVCYGGSINEDNYLHLLDFVDGLCFGRLSRKENFNDIIKNIAIYIQASKTRGG